MSATIKELIALACCDNTTERRYFCQDFIFSPCDTHIYLKFESYNLQSKTWPIKVFIFMSKMISLTYKHL